MFTKVIDGVRYFKDRPKNCRQCYFWGNIRRGCVLPDGNCYYRIHAARKQVSPCTNCPYGRNAPCVGWCTKKLLGEL